MQSPNKSFKAIITNIVTLNVGDKAIHEAMERVLFNSQAVSEVVAIEDSDPEVAKRVYPDMKVFGFAFPIRRLSTNRYKNFILMRILKLRAFIVVGLASFGMKSLAYIVASQDTKNAIQRLENADVFISTGGTYIIEKYGYTNRLLGFILAVAYGKPVILFTQSMGPFTSFIGVRLIKFAFPKFKLILLRDQKSLEHIKELGISTENCRVVPDVVFSMAELNSWSEREYPVSPKKIAISVRECGLFHKDGAAGQERYEANVAALVTEFVRNLGADVTFISTCQGIPEYKHDDGKTGQSIFNRLADDVREKTLVTNHFMNPTEFQEEMKAFDLLISTRMHGAIQGLNAGTPVIPIAYEFKINEVWKLLGMPEYVIPFDEADANVWLDKLKLTLETYPQYIKNLEAKMKELQPEAAKAGDYVREALRP